VPEPLGEHARIALRRDTPNAAAQYSSRGANAAVSSPQLAIPNAFNGIGRKSRAPDLGVEVDERGVCGAVVLTQNFDRFPGAIGRPRRR